MFCIEAEVWKWSSAKSETSWHFITIPEDKSASVRRNAPKLRGFGSVRVVASIGKVQWKTSMFPQSKTKCYILPIKADVRKRLDISDGDFVTVYIEIEHIER